MRTRVKDTSDWYLGLGLIFVVLLSQLAGDCTCGVELQIGSEVQALSAP